MMGAVLHPPQFSPRQAPQRTWLVLCFLLLIAVGWGLTLLLTESLSIEAIDTEPFERIERGDYIGATPSLLYTLFVVLFFQVGSALFGFGGGVLVFAAAQSLLLASACACAVFWLYTRGVPLWLCLIVSLIIAALIPLSHAAVQPHVSALFIVCLFLVVLGLIDSVADNCARLRRLAPVCALLILLSVLLFLDPVMTLVVVSTLIALCLTPTRVKGRLCLLVLAALALCAAALFIAAPALGWTGASLARLWESFSGGLNLGYIPPVILALGALVWVLLCRRPRYLLPFVPLLAFGLLNVFLQPQHALETGLFASAFILCLPFLILIPLVREYHETKGALRRRFRALRAAIDEEERDRRSKRACGALLDEIKKEVAPNAGYIGLYAAQGSEMTLNHLAVGLGALGYRTAYPLVVSGAELGFFTTLGVSDEALFDSLLEGDFLGSALGMNPDNLGHVEPSGISALVVPGTVFDKDRYRIGQGRGCYDRYIAQLERQIPTWGIGFREQLVESVPVEDHDERLSGIVVA
jgi:5,10-methenyltetrahydrofolate synthetase